MVKLTLTMKDFEKLHKTLETRKKLVTVDRQALTDLLIDHTNLLQDSGHNIDLTGELD